MEKIYFVSLGCSKNAVDSEVMLGKLKDYKLTSDPKEASVIVINTCAFIHDAKEESVNTILEMIDYKINYNCKCLVVAGCLSQRYFEELEKEIPEVDIFIGVGDYHKIFEFLKFKDSKICVTQNPTYIHSEKDERVLTTPHYTAWLKVSEGCNRNCTYCAIPLIRGKLRSRTVNSLVEEAKILVEKGVTEINLISQDFSEYGTDLGGENTILNLLQSLEKLDGLKWIRIMYFYPDDLSEEVMDFIASSEKICKYLDIPVQHFSDSVLKRMNRKITGEEILHKLKHLRTKIPNIVLRTSIIVGFPGETDEDFKYLVDGIKKAQFDHLGVFKYSEEEGTPAIKLFPKIKEDIIEQRHQKIYRLQEKIAKKMNQKFLGEELEVLVEGLHEDSDLLYVGHHQGQAILVDGKVIINDGPIPKIGDYVKVKITEVLGHDLVGYICS